MDFAAAMELMLERAVERAVDRQLTIRSARP